jgi:hypothetical protein
MTWPGIRAESMTKKPLASGPPTFFFNEAHKCIPDPATAVRSIKSFTRALQRSTFLLYVGQLRADKIARFDNLRAISRDKLFGER